MRLVLCQSAEGHADGTYSIVRGGLMRWRLDEVVQFVVFVEATLEEVPPGQPHSFILSWKGCGTGGYFAGYAGTPDGAKVVNLVVPAVALNPTSEGTITVSVKINKHEASTPITIGPAALVLS